MPGCGTVLCPCLTIAYALAQFPGATPSPSGLGGVDLPRPTELRSLLTGATAADPYTVQLDVGDYDIPLLDCWVYYKGAASETTFIHAPTGNLTLNPSNWNQSGCYGGIAFASLSDASKLDFQAVGSDDGIFEFNNVAWSESAQLSINYTYPLLYIRANPFVLNPNTEVPGPVSVNIYSSQFSKVNPKIGPLPVPLPFTLIWMQGATLQFQDVTVNGPGNIIVSPQLACATQLTLDNSNMEGGIYAAAAAYYTIITFQGSNVKGQCSFFGPRMKVNADVEGYDASKVVWSGGASPDNLNLVYSTFAPTLGSTYSDTGRDAWRWNPVGLPPNVQGNIDYGVTAFCAGPNCTDDYATNFGFNGAMWFRPASGRTGITVNNTLARNVQILFDLAELYNDTVYCSSYASFTIDKYGRSNCHNQSLAQPPNGTLEAGAFIGLDTSNPNLTVINNLGLQWMADNSGSGQNLTNAGVTVKGVAARTSATVSSALKSLIIDALIRAGTGMTERIATGETYFDNDGVLSANELKGVVRWLVGNSLIIETGSDYIMHSLNPDEITTDKVNTKELSNPSGGSVCFSEPPTICPSPTPEYVQPPPNFPPNGGSDPGGGNNDPSACGACPPIVAIVPPPIVPVVPGSECCPPGGGTQDPSSGDGGNEPTGCGSCGGGVDPLVPPIVPPIVPPPLLPPPVGCCPTDPGGVKNDPASGGSNTDPTNPTIYTDPPPQPFGIPAYNETLPSGCQPGQEYWNIPLDCRMECQDDGTWYCSPKSCPVTDVCASGLILESDYWQIGLNRTYLSNSTEVIFISLPNITQPILAPDIGMFFLPDGRGQFNKTWLRQPVQHLIVEPVSGATVNNSYFAHNNVTITCSGALLCPVTTSVVYDANLDLNFTNYRLDFQVNGFTPGNGTNATAVTSITCGAGLSCPENGSAVTVEVVGFTNVTFTGGTQFNGSITLNGQTFSTVVSSLSNTDGNLVVTTSPTTGVTTADFASTVATGVLQTNTATGSAGFTAPYGGYYKTAAPPSSLAFWASGGGYLRSDAGAGQLAFYTAAGTCQAGTVYASSTLIAPFAASDPVSGTAGQLYVNTADNRLHYYSNSAWRSTGTVTSITVSDSYGNLVGSPNPITSSGNISLTADPLFNTVTAQSLTASSANINFFSSAAYINTQALGSPTCSAGTPLGTGPTLTCSGSDLGFLVTAVPGTSPGTFGGTVFTWTYAHTRSSSTTCVFSSGNFNAAQLATVAWVFSDTIKVELHLPAGTGLSTGASYTWRFNCI